MQVYDLAPVIADVILAHCPGTSARDEFGACVSAAATSLGPPIGALRPIVPWRMGVRALPGFYPDLSYKREGSLLGN